MSTTYNKVVDLINQASLETGKSEKLELLRQVQELIINKESALLDNFFEELLLGFQIDPSADIRCFIIGFLEQACKKDQTFLMRALTTTISFLVDESVAVSKRAIQAASGLYRQTIISLARQQRLSSPKQIWDYAVSLRKQVLDRLASDNAGVRMAALKFLETLIPFHSLRSRTTENVGQEADVSLDRVPSSHPFLKIADLQNDGDKFMNDLTALLADPTATGAFLGAVAASLITVARMRPSFMGRVATAIAKLSEAPPKTLSATQIESLKRSLKSQLPLLLKHESSIKHHEGLVPACEWAGVDPTILATLDRRVKGRPGAPAPAAPAAPVLAAYEVPEPVTRKREAEPAVAAAVPKRPRFNVSFDSLQALPLPVLVEVLIASIVRLSESQHNPAPEMPSIAHGFATRLNRAVQDPRRPAAPARAASSDDVMQDTGAPPPTIAPIVPKPVEIPKEKPIVKKERPAFKFEPIALAPSAMARMVTMAIQRVLSARLSEVGAAREQAAVVARLIITCAGAFRAAEDPNVIALLDHVCASAAGRIELLLTWLHREHGCPTAEPDKAPAAAKKVVKVEGEDAGAAADGAVAMDADGGAAVDDDIDDDADEEDEKWPNRYEACVAYALSRLEAVESTEDKLSGRVLTELPALGPAATAHLYRCCVNPDRATHGLVTLRDAILSRPAYREEGIQLLLQLCASADPELRTNSIVVAAKFFALPALSEAVRIGAIDLASKLRDLPVDDTTGLDERASSHAQLLLDLCGQEPKLLQDLLQLYAPLPNAIKQVVLRLVEQPLRGLTPTHVDILAAIEQSPPGAETLVLRMLNLLTEKLDRAPPVLAAAVKKLHDTTAPDARMLVPVLGGFHKKELQDLLPVLVPLRNFGTDVLNRLLGTIDGLPHAPVLLGPVDLLTALHGLDVSKLAESVIQAVSACLKRTGKFTQSILETALAAMAADARRPLPPLFMRTAILALTTFPRMRTFIGQLLVRLISRQVWQQPAAWDGFVLCLKKLRAQAGAQGSTVPGVLFQLPAEQFNDIMRNPNNYELRQEAYTALTHMRDSLRATLAPHIIAELSRDSVPPPTPAPSHPPPMQAQPQAQETA
eukprot:m.247541 g.247541  ORF g.247541 m.247541 type:complete len:1095 (-) comp15423_c0_seq1:329-3613(-)